MVNFFVCEDEDAFWSCCKIPCQNGRVSSAKSPSWSRWHHLGFGSYRDAWNLETNISRNAAWNTVATCKLWLRRIQFIRQRDKLRYNDPQDFECAILNTQEIIKEYRSFIYKRSHLDREKLANGLNYQDRLKSSLVKALKEKEKSKFEMLEDDVFRFLSNRDRINDLLGLRVHFLDRSEDVPLEDRDHLTLCDWIVTFLRKNYESVGLTEKSCPSKELLASTDFDPLSSAVETITARARNLQQLIDVCELAESLSVG